jgi:hypothetical protein
MQAWVRILSVAAVAVVGAVLVSAEAPAALAYDDPSPNHGNVIRAWNPQYRTVHFARKISNEGGPVELPRPIDPPPGINPFGGGSQAFVPGSKTAPELSGALPMGRGASGAFDQGAKAERSIQQVIRRLG